MASIYFKYLETVLDKKNKLHISQDLGDCEYIHVAINGQMDAAGKKKRRVDVFTADDPEQIKCRLMLALSWYHTLELWPHRYVNDAEAFKFDTSCFSSIYAVNASSGKLVEKIDVQDYTFESVYMRLRLYYDLGVFLCAGLSWQSFVMWVEQQLRDEAVVQSYWQ